MAKLPRSERGERRFESDHSDQLVRVVAPHFVAGIVMRDGVCVEAAPILKWAVGKSADALRETFRRKRWEATIVQVRSSAAEHRFHTPEVVGSSPSAPTISKRSRDIIEETARKYAQLMKRLADK